MMIERIPINDERLAIISKKSIRISELYLIPDENVSDPGIENPKPKV